MKVTKMQNYREAIYEERRALNELCNLMSYCVRERNLFVKEFPDLSKLQTFPPDLKKHENVYVTTVNIEIKYDYLRWDFPDRNNLEAQSFMMICCHILHTEKGTELPQEIFKRLTRKYHKPLYQQHLHLIEPVVIIILYF